MSSSTFNVLVFGHAGSGKSWLIDLIKQQEGAISSSSQTEEVSITKDNCTFKFWEFPSDDAYVKGMMRRANEADIAILMFSALAQRDDTQCFLTCKYFALLRTLCKSKRQGINSPKLMMVVRTRNVGKDFKYSEPNAKLVNQASDWLMRTLVLNEFGFKESVAVLTMTCSGYGLHFFLVKLADLAKSNQSCSRFEGEASSSKNTIGFEGEASSSKNTIGFEGEASSSKNTNRSKRKKKKK